MERFNKITIIGVGLIGGSIGLAVKKARLAREVVGVFRRLSTMKKALAMKAVDRGTLDIAKGVSGADLVIIATRVGLINKIAREAARSMQKGAILTDVGSVKGSVVTAVERGIPKGIAFVGSHPMAGSEMSGVRFARGDLFRGSICIITKTPRSPETALRSLRAFWKALGASVVTMSPSLHDRNVAQISHLPHLIAQALCLAVDEKSIQFASGSFKDATRVAFFNEEIWLDIFKGNRSEVIRSTDRFLHILKQIRDDLSRNRQKDFTQKIEKAKRIRERYLSAFAENPVHGRG